MTPKRPLRSIPNPLYPNAKTHKKHRDFVLEAASPTPGTDPGDEAPRMDLLAAAFDASPMKVSNPLPVDNAHHALGSVRGLGASPWVLFKLNLWRCALQMARDKATLGLWAAVSALIGALLGILYWQQVGFCFAVGVGWVDGWMDWR